uniref:Uncharacterized protein n=1 Tax=Utricularia reniformis TaxID=192314 RepID=A0A1Y0B4J2_9LAMI|nr:hypothetical protein AEK19_MT2095 [Utricularia reniformis]ART32249.1 hypothetical protein AEK19_MT2095 [Utricularia reniformis]
MSFSVDEIRAAIWELGDDKTPPDLMDSPLSS